MNREITFRAWSFERKKMYFDVQNTYDSEPKWSGGFGELLNDEDFVVMQSTGLKDKNGNKIYDGDIVKYIGWDKKDHIGRVEYSEKDCAFILILEKPIGHSVANEKDEVIGNIYENSELLNKIKN